METPTRLRREVEALTANMQALAALTPNTLQSRRCVCIFCISDVVRVDSMLCTVNSRGTGLFKTVWDLNTEVRGEEF